MGSYLSRPREDASAGAPKSFYLVVGKPGIRYLRGPNRGPLLYNVEIEQRDEEGTVQRAETLHLPASVPSKQIFKLVQRDSQNPHAGFYLQFKLSAEHPPTSVRVYAGVQIDYVDGEGLKISQSTSTQTPFCVFEQHEFGSRNALDFAQFQQPIFLHQLKRALPPSEIATPRSLTACPLVIEVLFSVAPPAAPSSPSRRSAASPITADPCTTCPTSAQDGSLFEEGQPTLNAGVPSGTGSQVYAPISREEEVEGLVPSTVPAAQYTFLNFPLEALEGKTAGTIEGGGANAEEESGTDDVTLPYTRSAHNGSAGTEERSGAGNGARSKNQQPHSLVYPAQLIKQYLQCGCEVYELDDIFDLEEHDDEVESDDDDNAAVENDTGDDVASGGAAQSNRDGSASPRRRKHQGAATDVVDDDDDSGLCVVCLSQQRDTTIIPCRHMCLCYECAIQLRHQSNCCPICRRTIEKLMTL